MASGIANLRKQAQETGGEAYQSRRAEIIKAAARVFREKGFDAATLNDIAKKLKTDRTSLYYYIGSKEDLLHEMVGQVLDENVAAAEAVLAQAGTPVDKIRALIEHMVLSFDRNPLMYVYVEDLARIARQRTAWARDVIQKTKRFETIVVEIMEDGRADGTFRSDLPNHISAMALFGMINWTHRWYSPGSAKSAREIAETFTALFLDGYRYQSG